MSMESIVPLPLFPRGRDRSQSRAFSISATDRIPRQFRHHGQRNQKIELDTTGFRCETDPRRRDIPPTVSIQSCHLDIVGGESLEHRKGAQCPERDTGDESDMGWCWSLKMAIEVPAQILPVPTYIADPSAQTRYRGTMLKCSWRETFEIMKIGWTWHSVINTHAPSRLP